VSQVAKMGKLSAVVKKAEAGHTQRANEGAKLSLDASCARARSGARPVSLLSKAVKLKTRLSLNRAIKQELV